MKYRFISYFLLGVLLTLLIFGFIFPLFPSFSIDFLLPGSRSEGISAIISLTSSIVALTIATWGIRLRRFGDYKSNIKIADWLGNIQENEAHTKQGQTRLKFENNGKNIAEDVEVYVDKIYDNGRLRKNFISVPLTWTHSGSLKRSFQERQYGYLDLCRRDNIEVETSTPKLVLIPGAGIPTYQNLGEGDTVLRLMIFQKYGKRKTYRIHLNWVANQPLVRVTKIVKVM